MDGKCSYLEKKPSVLGSRLFGSQFYVSSRIFGYYFQVKMAHSHLLWVEVPPRDTNPLLFLVEDDAFQRDL